MRQGILIINNGVDYSDNLVLKSLNKQETLNNNKNTCGFSLANVDLAENSIVYVWDSIYNIVEANAGDNFIYFNDVYDIENKFAVGTKFIIDIQGEEEEKVISAVDSINKKITFTTNLENSYPVKTNCGKIFFGGVVDLVNQEQVSKSSTDIRYNYQLVSFEKFLDKKVVIDTYQNMYMREIIGRMIYQFVANDSNLNIFDFGSAITGAGTGNNTTDYYDDKIQGTYCQKATTTGAGTATWTKTISSIDLSTYTDIRYWRKVKIGEGYKISSFKVRIGQDASNYFEYNNLHIGENWEDCRLYESVKTKKPDTIVGSPTRTGVVRFQYEIISSASVNYILFDYLFGSIGGVTITNAKKGQKYVQVRYKGKNVSSCFEDLTKKLGHFWYMDYDRDLHYYYSDGESTSTFQITPTEKNYSSLDIKVDTSQIVNRQLVEGNEAPGNTLYTQLRIADGTQDSFNLDYKPVGERKISDTVTLQGLKMRVDGVPQTIGPEGITDPTTVDFIYNFNEKVVMNASASVVAAGKEVKRTYYPYKVISVRYANRPAIAAMKLLVGGDGIFEGQIIIDKGIDTFEVARQRAVIEVNTRKDPLVSYVFNTDVNGLQLGQMVYVNDPLRGVNKYFQVQKINTKCLIGNLFSYRVEVTTRFFDYVEFFQLILKKSGNLLINDSVDVIIPANDDEVITITDSSIPVITTSPYFAGSKYNKFYRFTNESGTSIQTEYIGENPGNRWYLRTPVALDGQASFATDASFNIGKVLELQNLYSTSGKTSSVTLMHSSIDSNRSFTFYFRLKVYSIGAGSGTIKVYIREYDSSDVILATQTITIANETSDYDLQRVTFTTNVNTVYYDIKIEIDELVATVRLGGFYVKDNSIETVINPGYASFSTAS